MNPKNFVCQAKKIPLQVYDWSFRRVVWGRGDGQVLL